MISPIVPENSIQISSGAKGFSFAAGEVVLARVTRAMGDSVFRIAIQGRVLTVTSNVPLVSGRLFRAQVEIPRSGQGSGGPAGGILLRILTDSQQQAPETLVGRMLDSAGISGSVSARELAAALLRSGIPVDPGRISSQSYTLSKTRRGDAESARIIALGADRGVFFSSEEVDELLTALHGGRHERETGGSGSHGAPRDGVDSDSKARKQGTAAERGALSAMLRDFVNRSTAVGNSLIQLFNHLPSSRDPWIVVPFGYDTAAQTVTGSLRFRLAPDGRSVERTALVVSTGSDDWVFTLRAGRIDIFTNIDITESTKRELAALGNVLRGSGYSLSGEIRDIAETDGFDPIDSRASTGGVDFQR